MPNARAPRARSAAPSTLLEHARVTPAQAGCDVAVVTEVSSAAFAALLGAPAAAIWLTLLLLSGLAREQLPQVCGPGCSDRVAPPAHELSCGGRVFREDEHQPAGRIESKSAKAGGRDSISLHFQGCVCILRRDHRRVKRLRAVLRCWKQPHAEGGGATG